LENIVLHQPEYPGKRANKNRRLARACGGVTVLAQPF
jgi:hypothetical protein